MKKQILILVNILLCTFAFSQDPMNGFPLEILKGTYQGHKFDFGTSKMDTSKDYKVDFKKDNTLSIGVKVGGNWRELIAIKVKAESAKPSELTEGIAYQFEVLNSPNYKSIGITTVGENRLSTYGKGVLFQLIPKESNNILIYVMDKDGGNPNPEEAKKDRVEYAKQKKKDKKRRKKGRDELRWGAMAGAGYLTSNHNFDGINSILNQNNDTHAATVEQGYNEMSNLWGVFAEGDIYYKNIFVGMDLGWRQNETFIRRPDDLGTSRQTYFRIEHRTTGAQLGLILHPNNFLKIAFGGTFNSGKYKFLWTRIRTDDDRKGAKLNDLITPQDAKVKHAGGFAKIMLGNFKEEDGVKFRFFVEGQYMVGLDVYDLSKVNEAVNPTTFMNAEKMEMDNSFIGLKIGLLAGLGL